MSFHFENLSRVLNTVWNLRTNSIDSETTEYKMAVLSSAGQNEKSVLRLKRNQCLRQFPSHYLSQSYVTISVEFHVLMYNIPFFTVQITHSKKHWRGQRQGFLDTTCFRPSYSKKIAKPTKCEVWVSVLSSVIPSASTKCVFIWISGRHMERNATTIKLKTGPDLLFGACKSLSTCSFNFKTSAS